MDFSLLEQRIGYEFKDKTLLETAFVHSTQTEKYGGKSNERMEYLGDAVLELIVSEKQYRESDVPEGEMTKERQRLVCKESLLALSEALGLKDYLSFYGKESSNVGEKTISSLYESLVAAIYLDGGFYAAKTFVLNHYPTATASEENHKGKLQEYLQKRGKNMPNYGEPIKTGADHAPEFFATVRAGDSSATGTGKSKRQAEQQAAKNLLKTLLASDDKRKKHKE
jgi:ribonuclease-3